MKISFESQDEIQRISDMTQDVYPADIIFDAEDAFDVAIGNNDRELPLNTDGFHLGPLMRTEYKDEKLNNQVGKKDCKNCDKNTSPADYSDCAYVAGQLDALFSCIRENKLTYGDVADVTGRSAHEIRHLYLLWVNLLTLDFPRKWSGFFF